jgi:hypothetical protein
MTNLAKASCVLAIVMEELNMPKGSTIGDVALALKEIDPGDENMDMLKPLIRNAVIDEIQKDIAVRTICRVS